jgi:hypothetical protein
MSEKGGARYPSVHLMKKYSPKITTSLAWRAAVLLGCNGVRPRPTPRHTWGSPPLIYISRVFSTLNFQYKWKTHHTKVRNPQMAACACLTQVSRMSKLGYIEWNRASMVHSVWEHVKSTKVRKHSVRGFYQGMFRST